MFNSRKGISSVFSNVLLILITVLGMTALFSFTTHYFTDFQLRQGSALMEGLVLEDTWFKDDIDFPSPGGVSQGIILNFYNYGKIGLTIKQIYINGDPLDEFFSLDLNGDPVHYGNLEAVSPSDFVEIKIGEHGSIILNKPISIGEGINIKIYTERNSKFEFNVRRQ